VLTHVLCDYELCHISYTCSSFPMLYRAFFFFFFFLEENKIQFAVLKVVGKRDILYFLNITTVTSP
jgi:hypothetical protein